MAEAPVRIVRPGKVAAQDEGVALGNVRILNFAGAGVTAAVSGDKVTATIPGASASALDDLTDVTITTPSAGEFVRKGAGDWVNSAILDADVPASHSGSAHHAAVTIGTDAEHSLSGQVLSGADAAAAQKGHVQLAGELGGTADSPTVATVHSGSAHHTQSHNHSAAGDGTALTPVSVVPSGFLTAPNGAGGPTIDAVGKVGVDTTTRTLNFHDGTAEVVLNPVKQASFFIETPTATDDWAFIRLRAAATIIEIDYLCVGGTNWVGQVQEGDANGANGADTQAADTTALAGTNNQVTSFSNAAIDAGDYLILKTTSISGTPTGILVTVYWRENP